MAAAYERKRQTPAQSLASDSTAGHARDRRCCRGHNRNCRRCAAFTQRMDLQDELVGALCQPRPAGP